MNDLLLAVIAVALLVAGQFFGQWVHRRAHTILPMNDPVSLLVIVLAVSPLLLGTFWDAAWDLAMEPEYWICVVALLVGYVMGYRKERTDVVYVAVHDIVRRTQDVYPVVRYTAPDGRQCWQPQRFLAVCRSMLLGVHDPLQLMAVSNPRSVSIKSVFLKIEAQAYDMAAVEVREEEVRKFHHTFKIEARKYVSSPHNTDAPYDWIVNATGYEQLFLEYCRQQTEDIDRMINLDIASLKGAKLIMEAAGAKTPSREFMDELGIDLEGAMTKELAHADRKVKKSLRGEYDDDRDHPDNHAPSGRQHRRGDRLRLRLHLRQGRPLLLGLGRGPDAPGDGGVERPTHRPRLGLPGRHAVPVDDTRPPPAGVPSQPDTRPLDAQAHSQPGLRPGDPGRTAGEEPDVGDDGRDPRVHREAHG